MAVSSGLASWAELATVISVEDLHDILEVARVDAHNAAILKRRLERENR